MRLEGWHIDGYGRFVDASCRSLSPGLTVFHGPNEAGKSTLLSFVQNMLFGFPRANAKRGTLIPPLAGGRHGGRLIVVGDGPWTIERHRDPNALSITGPDGEAGSEADIEQLLHRVERSLFESVFAFSLRELEQLGGLDDEALQRQLFAAGLTGVGRSAEDALAALSSQAEGLYRPRSTSELRDAWERLKELRSERRTALDAVGRYDDLRARESELTGEARSAHERLEALGHEDRRLLRLHDLWAIENRRSAEAERLAALADPPEVTPRQLEHVRELEQRIAADDERLAEANAERERIERQLGTAGLDEALLEAAETVKAVAVDLPLQRQRSNDRVAAERDVKMAEQALTESLSQLGPTWSAERVKRFDASLPRRTEIDEWIRDTAEAQVKARDAERTARTCATAHEEAVRALADAESALAGLAPPLEEAAIGAALADMAHLKAARVDRDVARRDLEAARERLASLQDSAPSAAKADTEPALPTIILYGIGAIAIACGIAIAAAGELMGGVIGVCVGVAVIVAIFVAGRVSHAAAHAAAQMADRAADHARRLAETETRIAELDNAVRTEQDRAATLAISAGLSDDASSEEIEARVLALQREHTRLDHFTERERAVLARVRRRADG